MNTANTITTTLIWLRPEWLWLLIPTLLAILLYPSKNQTTNPWEKVCDPHLLKTLTQHQQQSRASHLPRLFIAIACSLLILAMAGPSWQERFQPVYQQQSALIVALDMSAAMMDEDLPPSRLNRAKFKLKDLFSQWVNGSVGLIAYTKQAFVASPLTTDTNTLTALLPALKYNIMPVRGSDANAALEEAERLITQSKQANGHILLVTAAHIPDSAVATAKRLQQQQIHTHVYGLRTDAQYQQLANAGHGELFRFSHDNHDIQQILDYFKNQRSQATQQSQQLFSQRVDQGYWLLWLLLPFVVIAFRRGWLERLTV